jgi:hypothetical protein
MRFRREPELHPEVTIAKGAYEMFEGARLALISTFSDEEAKVFEDLQQLVKQNDRREITVSSPPLSVEV